MDKQNTLRYMTPLVMGGAGFGYQLNANPEAMPVAEILRSAFDSGVRTIDTSPYYEPSEQLLGAALQEKIITEKYSRDQYFIMTKVGRVTEQHLDYSPDWIHASVERSLARFNTDYLDVVFAHDVELVTFEEAISAVRVLLDIAKTGRIHYVGISGYNIDVLSAIANVSPKIVGQPIDVVQTWAQLTLQNTRLEKEGFSKFRAAGVKMVFCSSPLAVGLLRSESVPVGRLGNWHPAPEGLRRQASIAAAFVAQQGDELASLALRYALHKAQRNSSTEMLVSTICGVSSKYQLDKNVETARIALGYQDLSESYLVNESRDMEGTVHSCLMNDEAEKIDAPLCEKVREILEPWIDYDFSTKKIASEARVEDAQAVLHDIQELDRPKL